MTISQVSKQQSCPLWDNADGLFPLLGVVGFVVLGLNAIVVALVSCEFDDFGVAGFLLRQNLAGQINDNDDVG